MVVEHRLWVLGEVVAENRECARRMKRGKRGLVGGVEGSVIVTVIGFPCCCWVESSLVSGERSLGLLVGSRRIAAGPDELLA